MFKSAAVVCFIFAGCAGLQSQDWLVDGHDPQRTGWQKEEKTLTTSNVQGLKLLWKVQTDSLPPDETGGFGIGRNLFPPLVVTNVRTSSGIKEVALLATMHDYVYA